MLDLILSYGLSVTEVEVVDSAISDHFPILFKMSLPLLSIAPVSNTTQACAYLPNFEVHFIKFYNEVNLLPSLESPLPDLDVEHHFSLLNMVWEDTLSLTAPFKSFKPKVKSKSEPWVDYSIRSLRQLCRKAERKWKKDKLQISYEILRDCLLVYQNVVKKAKASYFTELIDKHHHTPKALFSVVNSVLNPPINSSLPVFGTLCVTDTTEADRW